MFGPITNTLLKVMKPNPSKHGETGWGRVSLPQGQVKVICQVKSAKKGENSKFLLFLLQLY